jgi:hypothetical protein
MNCRRIAWLAGSALLVCLAGVAQAQEGKCEVKREPFVNGGVSKGSMAVEPGGVCRFQFKFGQINPPDSWKIVEAPKSGTVVFKGDVAEYQPNAGFTGEDRFVIEVFGRAPNCGTRCTRDGRYDFSVNVKSGG